MSALLRVIAVSLAGLFSVGCGGYANDAECVLDQVVEAQNDRAALTIANACKNTYDTAGKGDGRGWFSYKDGNACILDKAKMAKSQVAANLVRHYCLQLYDKPSITDDFERFREQHRPTTK